MIRALLFSLALILPFSANAQSDDQLFQEFVSKVCMSRDFSCPLQSAFLKKGVIRVTPKTVNKPYDLSPADVVPAMQRMNEAIAQETAGHGGDRFIGNLEATKRELGYLKFACSGLGAACIAGAGAVISKTFWWGVIGIGACTAASGACVYVVDNMQNDIQKAIDDIKEACAQGDDPCYEKVTGQKIERAPGNSTSGGAGGAEGSHAPTMGPGTATIPSTTTVVIHGSEVTIKDPGVNGAGSSNCPGNPQGCRTSQ